VLTDLHILYVRGLDWMAIVVRGVSELMRGLLAFEGNIGMLVWLSTAENLSCMLHGTLFL
jgi:hypothetical protein